MKTLVKVGKWGNSSGVRFPRKALEAAGITDGDVLELVPENGSITLRKKHHDLDAFFAKYAFTTNDLHYTREELHER